MTITMGVRRGERAFAHPINRD